VISLDGLREELGVEHAAPQDAVLELAWARATRGLRTGQGFAWNATNCRRRQRAGLVARLQGLGAKVTLLSLEAPHAVVSRRNAQRARSLTGAAWEGRLEQWESVWPGEADDERWYEEGPTELR
jgi:predicted kinase